MGRLFFANKKLTPQEIEDLIYIMLDLGLLGEKGKTNIYSKIVPKVNGNSLVVGSISEKILKIHRGNMTEMRDATEIKEILLDKIVDISEPYSYFNKDIERTSFFSSKVVRLQDGTEVLIGGGSWKDIQEAFQGRGDFFLTDAKNGPIVKLTENVEFNDQGGNATGTLVIGKDRHSISKRQREVLLKMMEDKGLVPFKKNDTITVFRQKEIEVGAPPIKKGNILHYTNAGIDGKFPFLQSIDVSTIKEISIIPVVGRIGQNGNYIKLKLNNNEEIKIFNSSEQIDAILGLIGKQAVEK